MADSLQVATKDRAVFFTTDRGYLVPTLVAAPRVLARDDVTAVADVLLFLVGFTAIERDKIAARFVGESVRFLAMPPEQFALPDDATF